MATKPLYSSNGVPIYGELGRPVYGDIVFDDDFIFITFTGLQYPLSFPPEGIGWFWDTTCWCIGYGSDASGLYHHDTPLPAGDERDSMKYWLPVEGVYETYQWDSGPPYRWPGPFTSRFDFASMVTNEFGKGNDGTNDYYQITVMAGHGDDGGSILNHYCKVRAWKNMDTIEATYAVPETAVFDENNKRWPNDVICRIRWTPATSTLSFE